MPWLRQCFTRFWCFFLLLIPFRIELSSHYFLFLLREYLFPIMLQSLSMRYPYVTLGVISVIYTSHCRCFALSAVLKGKMIDENELKCIQHENIVGWTRKCWMKSLIKSKLHPTSTNMIFFFFFIFIQILKALKSIQHRKFSMLDEMLDAFAPALMKQM